MVKREQFNSDGGAVPFQQQCKGLYDAANEHDACGVGMLVNIHGNKSHEIVDSALKVLENMRHRGAEGADNKTGDGAGIMLQIPHEFILLQGIPVPEKGKYGTGLVFLPKDEKEQADILSIMIDEIEKQIFSMEEREIPSVTIGELVMKKLKMVDEVAYVRFASVYREFKDVNAFMDELAKFLNNK